MLLSAPDSRLSYVFTCIALWSACFYLVITNFLGGTVEVQGDSMLPTLSNGETYMMNRWACQFREPRRGELVVIRDPGYRDMAIKRVVAMSGEVVEFRDSAVFINGVRFFEPYIPRHTVTAPANLKATRFSVPKNHFFVLGDNRPNSLDSRWYGAIHRSQIVGLVTP